MRLRWPAATSTDKFRPSLASGQLGHRLVCGVTTTQQAVSPPAHSLLCGGSCLLPPHSHQPVWFLTSPHRLVLNVLVVDTIFRASGSDCAMSTTQHNPQSPPATVNYTGRRQERPDHTGRRHNNPASGRICCSSSQ